MPSRDYPDIRKPRGTRSKDMVLFSARKSKQDIIAEALMLHRSVNESESLE